MLQLSTGLFHPFGVYGRKRVNVPEMPMNSDNRREAEELLLEELRQRHQEWRAASRENRDSARERFEDTLKAFDNLVLQGRRPRIDKQH